MAFTSLGPSAFRFRRRRNAFNPLRGLGQLGGGNLRRPNPVASNPMVSNPSAILQILLQQWLMYLWQFFAQQSSGGLPFSLGSLGSLLGGVGQSKTVRQVDGTKGSFALDTSGGYGKNAAVNRKALVDNGTYDPNQTTVRYTPADKPLFNDALGYAQKAIEFHDTNKDETLSLEEFSKQFSSAEEAKKAFEAIDVNKDQKLDVPEIAGLTFVADANGDGQITPEERNRANSLLSLTPENFTVSLKEVLNTLELNRRYTEFKK